MRTRRYGGSHIPELASPSRQAEEANRERIESGVDQWYAKQDRRAIEYVGIDANGQEMTCFALDIVQAMRYLVLRGCDVVTVSVMREPACDGPRG